MPSHLEHLKEWCPDILDRRILDLGSGRGSFLIDVAKHGGKAVGIETSENYIQLSLSRAKETSVPIKVTRAFGEHLPFDDSKFDFINIAEVIEHVTDPILTLKEALRVLKPGGIIYMSVPNRFGMKDQHYGIYCINWLPRSWSMSVLSFFGAHKDYSTEKEIGCQRLDSMHYFTFGSISRLCRKIGFEVDDIREQKISVGKGIKRWFMLLIYKIARFFYFDSFHLKLTNTMDRTD